MKERLQKLLSAAGVCSRRQAETLIAAGRVCVNGLPASLGQSADPETDAVTLDGKALRFGGERICLMLNKPRGYVTTLSDEKGRPTVAELVRGAPERVYPVGRLDMDSDGLLLMTNDGALANALMHPRHAIPKTYRTEVTGDISLALPVLRAPMEIDGAAVCADRVEPGEGNTLYITIHEGRNRQIRKMCDVAHLRVKRLTRISEGALNLGDLPLGQWRRLTDEEFAMLRNSAAAPENARK